MKKIITFLLIAVLAIGLLAACNPSDKGSNVSDVSNESNSSNEESGDQRYVADVPYKDYGGRTVVILTAGGSEDRKGSEFSYDFDEFEETPVNLSVEERNNKVEDLLGVKIVEEYIVDPQRFVGGALKERVELANVIGEDTFQLVVPSLYNCGALAAGGSLYDLNSFEYLHKLSSPWWDQNFVEDLMIDGKMFFITGDIGISTRNSITVCYFNKQMFKDNDLGDPY